MFRYLESLVDPYVAYEETDRPPSRLWPFLRDDARPFRRVFVQTAAMSVVAVELRIIRHLGRWVGLGRPNATTGWIFRTVSSFLRNLGVIEEEMRTIAQSIALTDRPGAVPLRLSEGRIESAGPVHHCGCRAWGPDGVDLRFRARQSGGFPGLDPDGALKVAE